MANKKDKIDVMKKEVDAELTNGELLHRKALENEPPSQKKMRERYFEALDSATLTAREKRLAMEAKQDIIAGRGVAPVSELDKYRSKRKEGQRRIFSPTPEEDEFLSKNGISFSKFVHEKLRELMGKK